MHLFSICPVGNRHDAPEGRKWITIIYSEDDHYPLMDRTYEEDKPRALAAEIGLFLLFLRRKIAKILGIMMRICISIAMRSNVIF